MKKIFFFLFLLSSLTALAQNNDDAEDTIARPAITEKGQPDGNKTEIKMGTEGGTLTSPDGKLELVFPPGALSKKTNISIQPVTNLMPNGNGKAYSLEPSGLRFQQPIQLIFHYDPEEAEDTMQLLMGIATQDDKGQWYRLKDIALDTVAKTVTGNIPHFSVWANFEALKINPSYKRLKVNKQLILEINGAEDQTNSSKPSASTGQDDDQLAELLSKKYRATWSVNGIPNGNSTVGIIISTDRQKTNVTYKAPATVPDRSPVEAAAKLYGFTQKITYKLKKNGPDITTTFKDLRLVSNILVYDKAYEIEYSGKYKDLDVEVKDTARFVVTLNGNKSKVTDIYNAPYFNDFKDIGECKPNWLNKDACTGIIHLIGGRTIKITPSSANPDERLVDIDFILTRPVLPVVKYSCPKGPFTRINPILIWAYPQHIQFKDNGQEQTYIDKSSGLFSEAGFKIDIKPVKEDE